MEKELIRHILHKKYELSADIVGDDFDFLMDIFRRHPEAVMKLQSGVKRIWIERSKFNTLCFWIERNNGTKTDISFMACLTKIDYFKKACREEIEEQISDFKIKDKTPKGFHVDHHPESFDSILMRFIAISGRSDVVKSVDSVKGCSLKDREYAQKWRDFHLFHAILRSIPAQDNLRKK